METGLILILDASAETRAMYAHWLRHHGYAVAEAADGEEALRVSARRRPDLVVTELSGDAEWILAIQTLRWTGTDRATPMIACSTIIDPRWPFAPAGLDVDLALPKPTSPRTLLREARRLLARRTAGAAALAG